MRVLVVEEDPHRQAVFRAQFVDHELVIADTLIKALAALVSERFDLVFLKRRLRNNRIAGNVIARYIAVTMPTSEHPSEVIIHDSNLTAVAEMQAILLDTKRPPRVTTSATATTSSRPKRGGGQGCRRRT